MFPLRSLRIAKETQAHFGTLAAAQYLERLGVPLSLALETLLTK